MSQAPDWKTAYEEVCRQHDGIADFRAKLLGFLPLASGGAGVFLLLSDEISTAMPHLLAIGALGFLATFGLFWYELRGIQKCRVLIRCGRDLERRLLGEKDCPAAFRVRESGVSPIDVQGATQTAPEASRGRPSLTVGALGAALIIYPTVLAGWVYIAFLGLMHHLGLAIYLTACPWLGCSTGEFEWATAASPLREIVALLALAAAAAAMVWCRRWGWKIQKRQMERPNEQEEGRRASAGEKRRAH